MYHSASPGAARGSSRVVARPEILRDRPHLAGVFSALDRLFTVRVTRSFFERFGKDDALSRQVIPDVRELISDGGDLPDPVGEKGKSPVPWVVQKHPDRVLLLMTKRCHLYCRYCFRRTHAPEGRMDPTDQAWERALDFATASGAREAILSGGDPLACRESRLFSTIDRLQKAVPVVRIHTRAPITAPDSVTDSLVRGLSRRRPLWVIVHANHPAELTPEVDRALDKLVSAGIPVLNQAVLLRGVNDDADVLGRLCEALVERSVFPYYLHHADSVAGNAHFRVDLLEGLRLHAELRRRVSGVALPSYVIDAPDGSGKRAVLEWARDQGILPPGEAASRLSLRASPTVPNASKAAR